MNQARDIAALERRIAELEKQGGKIPLRRAQGGGGGGKLIHAANYAALAAITNKSQGTRGMTDDNGYIYVYRRAPGINSGNPLWRISIRFEQDAQPSSIGEQEGDEWIETDTSREWFYTGSAWEYRVRHHTSKTASNKKEGDLVTVSAKGYQCVDTGNDPPGTTDYLA